MDSLGEANLEDSTTWRRIKEKWSAATGEYTCQQHSREKKNGETTNNVAGKLNYKAWTDWQGSDLWVLNFQTYHFDEVKKSEHCMATGKCETFEKHKKKKKKTVS